MDINSFISFFKERVKPPVLDIFRQYENVIEAKTKPFIIPFGAHAKQKFVHSKFFEDCVRQAATNCLEDSKVIDEFISLYEKFCQNPCNFDQYIAGMKQVGSVAWNIVHYIQKQHASFTFGKRITNEHFTMLKPNLLIDFIQPTLIYDFKFSTEKSQEEYEKKYLINGLLQVCIYYLCLGLSPEYTKLGILVYYSYLNKVVFYTSNIHQDRFCVKILEEKMTENKLNDTDPDHMPNLEPLSLQLNKHLDDKDSDIMPNLEPMSMQLNKHLDDKDSDIMPNLEPLSIQLNKHLDDTDPNHMPNLEPLTI